MPPQPPEPEEVEVKFLIGEQPSEAGSYILWIKDGITDRGRVPHELIEYPDVSEKTLERMGELIAAEIQYFGDVDGFWALQGPLTFEKEAS